MAALRIALLVATACAEVGPQPGLVATASAAMGPRLQARVPQARAGAADAGPLVRSTKKTCNSSTMTILAPIVLLCREFYA